MLKCAGSSVLELSMTEGTLVMKSKYPHVKQGELDLKAMPLPVHTHPCLHQLG